MNGAAALLGAWMAFAQADSTPASFDADSVAAPAPEGASVSLSPPAAGGGLTALVPDAAEHPLRLDPGERVFLHRFAFSPGFGSLGAERLFSFRLAYNPNPWLAWEAGLSHNPGQSVHAVLHTVSAIVRRPLEGRWQPYLIGGYGMMIVFPGQSLNAAPVTKNALTLGGGLEVYVRGDLAVRAEIAQATVLGRQKDRDGVVAYDYLQQTIGLVFYRSVRP
jgi:hypothetical protein